MVQTKFFKKREDGVDLYLTKSDRGYCIERNGTLCGSAIEPADNIMEYTETNIPSGVPIEPENYQDALSEFGVGDGMTDERLKVLVTEAKAQTKEALETMYNTLNQDQQKKIVKDERVKALFDLYGVEYSE